MPLLQETTVVSLIVGHHLLQEECDILIGDGEYLREGRVGHFVEERANGGRHSSLSSEHLLLQKRRGQSEVPQMESKGESALVADEGQTASTPFEVLEEGKRVTHLSQMREHGQRKAKIEVAHRGAHPPHEADGEALLL